jgi:hypothetical protein
MSAAFTSYIVRFSPFIFLDSVTTAVWRISFTLVILSILNWTMIYASLIHNNLDCFGWNFDVLSNNFPSTIIVHLGIYIFLSCEPFWELTWYCSLPSALFNFLRLSLTMWNLWVCFYSLPVSPSLLPPPDSVIIVCYPDWPDIEWTWMSSPVYQNVVSLIMHLSIRF